MAARYCYFCDAPASRDPCPTCGKPLPRPEETTPFPTDRPPEIITGEATDGGVPRGRWRIWLVAIAAVIIIGVLLRSPFGI